MHYTVIPVRSSDTFLVIYISGISSDLDFGIWHIFWHFKWHLLGISSDILSGKLSGISSGMPSGILFGTACV